MMHIALTHELINCYLCFFFLFIFLFTGTFFGDYLHVGCAGVCVYGIQGTCVSAAVVVVIARQKPYFYFLFYRLLQKQQQQQQNVENCKCERKKSINK